LAQNGTCIPNILPLRLRKPDGRPAFRALFRNRESGETSRSEGDKPFPRGADSDIDAMAETAKYPPLIGISGSAQSYRRGPKDHAPAGFLCPKAGDSFTPDRRPPV